jgi:hypothetical protein
MEETEKMVSKVNKRMERDEETVKGGALVVLMPEAEGCEASCPPCHSPGHPSLGASTQVSNLLVFSPKRGIFAVSPRAIVEVRDRSMNDGRRCRGARLAT